MYVKKTTIFFIFLFSIVSFFQVMAQITNETIDITLKNNESISLDDFFEISEEFNPDLVLDHNLYYDSLIQSFSTASYNFSIIDEYLHHTHEEVGFGYKNILDGAVNSDYTPIPIFSWFNQINSVSRFQEYFHSLFQNKLARKLMFSAALNILENMCVAYPADFTDRVYEEINNLIEYVKIQNYYTSNIPSNYDNNYWKGFIYRRVEQDGVPLSEIESCLLETKKMLNQVESKFVKQKKVLNVNGLKVFLVDSETIRFEMHIIKYGEPYFNFYDYNFKDYQNLSLKYLQDSDGEYYLIEGGEEGYYGDKFRDLFDFEFVKIN